MSRSPKATPPSPRRSKAPSGGKLTVIIISAIVLVLSRSFWIRLESQGSGDSYYSPERPPAVPVALRIDRVRNNFLDRIVPREAEGVRRALEERVKGRGKAAASAMANFGNLIMRFVEGFISQHPPKLGDDGKYVHQYESELRDAISASKYYFEQAIHLDDHFGAHYSLALLLKSHQNLLDYDYERGGEEEVRSKAMIGASISFGHYRYATITPNFSNSSLRSSARYAGRSLEDMLTKRCARARPAT